MQIQLNREWSELFRKYRSDHRDPRNQACHKIGIPLIALSVPVGASVVGLPIAVPMFTVGWAFQLLGHYFEGKKPSFVEDKRSFFIGAMWCLEKYGVRIYKESPLERQ